MPAFAQWLLEGNERPALALFEQTRCAYEEQFLPDPMQRLRAWPRARSFIQTLPRGPYSRREYRKLCNPQQYTMLSDRYVYRHPPQLYQQSNALRSVWGAIVESFCLPWSPHTHAGELLQADISLGLVSPGELISHRELATLLNEAGLPELAREVELQAQAVTLETIENTEATAESADDESSEGGEGERDGGNGDGDGMGDQITVEDLDKAVFEEATPEFPGDCGEDVVIAAEGVLMGQMLNLLHLRGWLASISVRAMALFEFLACGRRHMPFGYEPGEPFGAFAGYLTPDEVWQLGSCLEDVVPPAQEAAEEDYLNFRYQHYGIPPAFRLIDEVLPVHASDFISAVRKARAEGLGLISSME